MVWRFPRRAVGVVFLLAGVGLALFLGTRAYHDWQTLQQPPAVGLQDPSRVRPWMTVRFIANAHGVPVAGLAGRLEAPPAGNVTLAELASRRGVPVAEEENEARQALAELGAVRPGPVSGPVRGGP